MKQSSLVGVDLLPPSQRPRERLLHQGAEALSDLELLALCMGTGTRHLSVFALAQRLISEFGSLQAVFAADPERLMRCEGIGQARVGLLKAVHELAQRSIEWHLREGVACGDSTTVGRYLQGEIAHLQREVFGCLYLDSRHRLICWEVLFQGSVNRAHVHPREVLKRGLQLNAAAVILGHNHPSGVAEPSQADLTLTDQLAQLLRQVDIRLLDHVVVSPQGYVSLASRGLFSPQD